MHTIKNKKEKDNTYKTKMMMQKTAEQKRRKHKKIKWFLLNALSLFCLFCFIVHCVVALVFEEKQNLWDWLCFCLSSCPFPRKAIYPSFPPEEASFGDMFLSPFLMLVVLLVVIVVLVVVVAFVFVSEGLIFQFLLVVFLLCFSVVVSSYCHSYFLLQTSLGCYICFSSFLLAKLCLFLFIFSSYMSCLFIILLFFIGTIMVGFLVSCLGFSFLFMCLLFVLFVAVLCEVVLVVLGLFSRLHLLLSCSFCLCWFGYLSSCGSLFYLDSMKWSQFWLQLSHLVKHKVVCLGGRFGLDLFWGWGLYSSQNTIKFGVSEYFGTLEMMNI